MKPSLLQRQFKTTPADYRVRFRSPDSEPSKPRKKPPRK
jgi:hypothetical protein